MTGVETMDVHERHKALARRWFEEGWSRGNVSIAPEIFAPYFVLRGKAVGPAGPQDSVRRIRGSFDPLSVSIDNQIAEGDLVVTQYTAHGRHTHDYRGISATGTWVTASGIQIWEIHNGKAVRDWNVFDEWSLLTQLGVELPLAVS